MICSQCGHAPHATACRAVVPSGIDDAEWCGCLVQNWLADDEPSREWGGGSGMTTTTQWSCEYVRTLGLPMSWVEWHDPTSNRCDGECVEGVQE